MSVKIENLQRSLKTICGDTTGALFSVEEVVEAALMQSYADRPKQLAVNHTFKFNNILRLKKKKIEKKRGGGGAWGVNEKQPGEKVCKNQIFSCCESARSMKSVRSSIFHQLRI